MIKYMRRWRKDYELLLLCVPALILILILKYLPMFGITIAFMDFKPSLGFFKSPWVGFKNFEFFFRNQDIWIVLRNTLGYNFAFIIIGNFVSLSFAIMMNEITKRKLVKFYQTTLFFPYFLSWTVVAYIVLAFLDPTSGILNGVYHAFGTKQPSWYTTPSVWPPIFILLNSWKNVGASSIIYYAAIMGIDGEYYEAALLDGANKFQVITKITIPLLKPIITMLVILSIGSILYSDFGLFYVVTNQLGQGLLNSSGQVIDTYVYNALLKIGDVGMSSAIGLVQSCVGFILVMITNFIVKKVSPDNSLF